jgi:hypothetical protein
MDPSKEQEVVALLDKVAQRIKSIPGIVACYSSWRSADGHGVTTAIYESQAAAEAGQSVATSVWAEMGPFMVAPPVPITYENVQNLLG